MQMNALLKHGCIDRCLLNLCIFPQFYSRGFTAFVASERVIFVDEYQDLQHYHMPQPTPKEPVQDDGATKDVASLEPAASVKRNPKFCFDDTLISIQIEDTLFNIHKYQLMESTTFSDMFAVAEESNDPRKNREGLSLDHPIVMLGVSASDFECLMTVLYARQVDVLSFYPESTALLTSLFLVNFVPTC
ncbi:hypothetical protein FS749_005578 [Ceratobasidium sp. UAMH 11750]|nr:hypothetical protein FS749_005578 [Ceratobasidium sp. UAMH 11750]